MEYATMLYVIIPIYMAEKYIAQTLESVLSQPFPNIHIVCVDDGSPDNSMSILLEYAQKYERIHIIQKENGGVSSARNIGIEYVLNQCKEDDYMTFLDADDLWARDATANLMNDFDEQPECIGYRYVRCSDDLTRTAPSPDLEARMLPGGSKNLWCHFDYPFGAVLYSCKFLSDYSIRFIDKLNYAEDQIFKFTCFYLAEKIKLVDKVFYCYRINQSSAMHRRKYGTEYMPDLIRGYLKTANFCAPYQNALRGESKFAKIMAGIHTIEMAQEHFQKFRSNRTLQQYLQENADISDAIHTLNPIDLSQNHRKLYLLYSFHPLRFRLMCYTTGFSMAVKDVLKRLPILTRMLNEKRYTLPNIYL